MVAASGSAARRLALRRFFSLVDSSSGSSPKLGMPRARASSSSLASSEGRSRARPSFSAFAAAACDELAAHRVLEAGVGVDERGVDRDVPVLGPVGRHAGAQEQLGHQLEALVAGSAFGLEVSEFLAAMACELGDAFGVAGRVEDFPGAGFHVRGGRCGGGEAEVFAAVDERGEVGVQVLDAAQGQVLFAAMGVSPGDAESTPGGGR